MPSRAGRILRLPPKWGLYLVNWIFQRVLRITGATSFSVHFTSLVGCGDKLQVHPSSELSFAVSGHCYIQAGNGIIIEKDVIFAPGVKMISANHDPLMHDKWVPAPPIVIREHCWIGANAVLLPGVEIGSHAVVGAGAVVTKSVPSRAVVGGIPARVLKYI